MIGVSRAEGAGKLVELERFSRDTLVPLQPLIAAMAGPCNYMEAFASKCAAP
jgi:hypothetical protein